MSKKAFVVINEFPTEVGLWEKQVAGVFSNYKNAEEFARTQLHASVTKLEEWIINGAKVD